MWSSGHGEEDSGLFACLERFFFGSCFLQDTYSYEHREAERRALVCIDRVHVPALQEDWRGWMQAGL